jgi:hypothetical protein
MFLKITSKIKISISHQTFLSIIFFICNLLHLLVCRLSWLRCCSSSEDAQSITTFYGPWWMVLESKSAWQMDVVSS